MFADKVLATTRFDYATVKASEMSVAAGVKPVLL